MTYGEHIKAARIQAGLTLREVAAHIGVSVPYLHDIERDRRAPFLGGGPRAAKLAELLKLDAERLAVLEALARGSVDVTGIDDAGVTKVVRLVEKMRRER